MIHPNIVQCFFYNIEVRSLQVVHQGAVPSYTNRFVKMIDYNIDDISVVKFYYLLIIIVFLGKLIASLLDILLL